MVLLERVINRKVFQLVKNSLIEEKVEVIVNPANRQLAHGGGVAGLIARAGGPTIQRESNEKSPVETGHATYTTAGNLPYKYIIHTVGPVYRGGTGSEAELLFGAVTSALQLANTLRLKSLALPAISTGIFGYPLPEAIRVISNAITRFLEGESTLEEVHLCEYSSEKAEEMKRLMEECFIELNIEPGPGQG